MSFLGDVFGGDDKEEEVTSGAATDTAADESGSVTDVVVDMASGVAEAVTEAAGNAADMASNAGAAVADMAGDAAATVVDEVTDMVDGDPDTKLGADVGEDTSAPEAGEAA